MAVVGVALLTAVVSARAIDKPNVVIILADDLGYADLTCYGAKHVETPRLDAMAKQGVRFTDFLTPSNVCSPSRAGLLTGRHPSRCGLPVAVNPAAKHREYGLHPEEITVAELLRERGYATGAFGKWHLGHHQPHHHPNAQGFDRYIGLLHNYRATPTLDENGKTVEKKTPINLFTKRITDEAIAFIEANRDKPFLVYLPHVAVHTPIAPHPDFKKSRNAYADWLRELDHRVGEVLDAIDRLGLDDRTLVVFTSDNGPTPQQRPSTGPLSGTKYTTMEGGHRVPCIMRMPGVIAAGRVIEDTTLMLDIFPTVARLTGAALPDDRTYDGVDLMPRIGIDAATDSAARDRVVPYYSGANLQAVRVGEWKLHLPRTKRNQPFWGEKRGVVELKEPRLHHLGDDIAEKRDVAGANPKVVADLKRVADKTRNELGDVDATGADARPTGLDNVQKIK